MVSIMGYALAVHAREISNIVGIASCISYARVLVIFTVTSCIQTFAMLVRCLFKKIVEFVDRKSETVVILGACIGLYRFPHSYTK
jgi:hypothetical protein